MTKRPQYSIYLIGAFLTLFLLLCCKKEKEKKSFHLSTSIAVKDTLSGISLIVLGTVQDAGSPQIGCEKECCRGLFDRPDPLRKVVSLGLIDHETGKRYIVEATPDIATQLHALNRTAGVPEGKTPDGIFLTHAHIGHYTGLMYLGKEAMHASRVPVYVMPRMGRFLDKNGPWDQLIHQDNIRLYRLKGDSAVALTPNLSVVPFLVPHRDEYSETVGFEIRGPHKKALFIPDIDKWERWDREIEEKIAQVDYAFLDATFFSGDELNTRNMEEIPHPFVLETLLRFSDLPASEKKKIRFIHFNHTNPLLIRDSEAYKKVISGGYGVAEFLEKIDL